MLDIAMNTKGAMDFNNLGSLMGGSVNNQTQQAMPQQNTFGQQGMTNNQSNPNQQNMNQGMGMGMSGQQPMQNNQGMGMGGQQPMQNNQGMGMGGQQPMQNNQGYTQNRQNQMQNNTQQAPVQHYEAKGKGGVILKKGGKTSLSKINGNNALKLIDVCLGWDVGGYTTYDLDSSCFMLGDNGKVIGDDWFVFYNQDVSPDNSIRHNGDNKTGAGDGDDEIITVDLSRLSQQVKKLAFVITISDAVANGYSFKNIANAYVRVVDKMSGKELAFFNLSDYYDGVTAMTVCEIYNHNGDWKINPVGNGLTNTGLEELCAFYGVNVAG